MLCYNELKPFAYFEKQSRFSAKRFYAIPRKNQTTESEELRCESCISKSSFPYWGIRHCVLLFTALALPF